MGSTLPTTYINTIKVLLFIYITKNKIECLRSIKFKEIIINGQYYNIGKVVENILNVLTIMDDKHFHKHMIYYISKHNEFSVYKDIISNYISLECMLP